MADGILSGLARRVYDVRDAAEEYGRDADRRVRGGGSEARGELRRLWSQLEDLVERNLGTSPTDVARTAGNYARTAGDYARDYARDGQEAAHDLTDQIRSATRARPFVAIGVAVAATLIITSLLSSARRR